MYACTPEIGRGFLRGRAHPATRPRFSTTHPQHKDRSPLARTPAQRGSPAALQWAALHLGVDVDHHPPSARAPLTSHPRATLHVVHTPLKASRTGALLVGSCPCSGHEIMP